MPREQRIDRQEQDNGDPDDTVWYVSVNGNGNRAYHENDDCQYIRHTEPKDTTREGAQKRWLAPCQNCILGGPQSF